MTSIERTAYPRFKRQFTTKELTEIYTPTRAEIAFAYATTKGESNILNLIVVFKAFQRLGYFPKLSDIPTKIVLHIRSHLKFPTEIVLGYENSKTMYRHRAAIREYLQVKNFNKPALHLAVESVRESALIMDNPADLMNVAIAELIKHRYELPGFNTLNRLVRRVRNLVNQKLFSLVLSRVDEDYQKHLLDLLERHPLEYHTPLSNLKQFPKSPTRKNINAFIIHLTWLDSFGNVKRLLDDITAAKISHFAAEARVLDAHELKDLNLAKRITLMVCLIYSAQVTARDSLVEMFLKQMRSINNDAKKELELIKQRIQETQERLVGVLANVLEVFVDEDCELTESDGLKPVMPTEGYLHEESYELEKLSSEIPTPDSYSLKSAQSFIQLNSLLNQSEPSKESLFDKLNNIFILDGGVEKLLSECESMNAYKGNNHLPLLWKFYKSHRQTFYRLINTLKFKATTSEESVVNALKFIQENSHKRGEFLTGSIELDFISESWQKLIIVKQGEQKKGL